VHQLVVAEVIAIDIGACRAVVGFAADIAVVGTIVVERSRAGCVREEETSVETARQDAEGLVQAACR
jgi:hypothetical protein